ncbi:hypothetical protein AWV80_00050, partial [Cupriavidus sp. UYMU48A]
MRSQRGRKLPRFARRLPRHAHHVGHQARLAGPILARHHHRIAYQACSFSRAAISPGSIRKPRILIWSSLRPR